MITNNNAPKLRVIGFSKPWKNMKLNNIAKIAMGKSPLRKNYTNKDHGYPFIQSVNDFRHGKIKARQYTSQMTKVSSTGDLLLTVRTPIGRAIINNKSKAIIGRGLANIKSPYNYFLYLIFNKMDYFDQWNQYSIGSGFFKSLKAKSLRDININLPSSLKEQHIIELLFKTFNHLINLQVDKINILKQIKTGWLQKIFNKKIYEHNWNKYKLKDTLIRGKIGGTPSIRHQEFYHGKIPFLKIADLNNYNGKIKDTKQHINERGINNSGAWIVPKGSISLSTYGQIGKPVKIAIPLATSQSFFSMIFKSRINTNFMYYLFQILRITDAWFPYTNTSSTVNNIGVSNIKSLNVFIPTIKMQRQIAKLFIQFDTVIRNNQNKLNLLIKLRDGYLQQTLC